MRGRDGYNESLFSTVRLEDFVPADHPLRPIRVWINEALAKLDELIRAVGHARNELLDLEELEEKDLDEMKQTFVDLAKRARGERQQKRKSNAPS